MKKPSSPNVVPSFESFSKYASSYNRVPVSLAFQADLETPLSVYLKLAGGPHGFLLESVEKHEQVARYSIVGFSPSGVYRAKDGVLTYQEGTQKKSFPAPIPCKRSRRRSPASARPPWMEPRVSWAAWLVFLDMTRSVISRNYRR